MTKLTIQVRDLYGWFVKRIQACNRRFLRSFASTGDGKSLRTAGENFTISRT